MNIALQNLYLLAQNDDTDVLLNVIQIIYKKYFIWIK